MSWNRETYLNAFGERLRHLPEEERLDAIREIDSTIFDGISDGLSEAAILNRLGDPVRLAKAYQSDYFLQREWKSPLRNIWLMISFYSTTGLLSAMVVPLLATITYGFGFCAAVTPLAGLLRTFGVNWISMSLAGENDVPAIWSLPYALVVALFLGAIAYGTRKLLHRYFRFVSRQHRKLLPNK
ncbi:DUF1700 domain-containing protein [Gorillibacterium sp. CAU 1737]|uniref:DUF1700 domain-containing protein n=1 Tax=Gorillibacterium sp. CAU 1737 TaxID=3140362 RepID=UPI0032602211